MTEALSSEPEASVVAISASHVKTYIVNSSCKHKDSLFYRHLQGTQWNQLVNEILIGELPHERDTITVFSYQLVCRLAPNALFPLALVAYG